MLECVNCRYPTQKWNELSVVALFGNMLEQGRETQDFFAKTSDSVAVVIGFSEHFSFLEHAWFCIQEPPVPDH